MKRELKKGFTFHLPNGDCIQRTYDHQESNDLPDNPGGGSMCYRTSKSTGATNRFKDPWIEVDEGLIAGQEHKFVPTEEEKKKAQAHVNDLKQIDDVRLSEHSKAHFKHMFEGMSDREKADFIAAAKELMGEEKVLEPAETKVIEPEIKKSKGCPLCGGPIRGRGFAHKDDCPEKK